MQSSQRHVGSPITWANEKLLQLLDLKNSTPALKGNRRPPCLTMGFDLGRFGPREEDTGHTTTSGVDPVRPHKELVVGTLSYPTKKGGGNKCARQKLEYPTNNEMKLNRGSSSVGFSALPQNKFQNKDTTREYVYLCCCRQAYGAACSGPVGVVAATGLLYICCDAAPRLVNGDGDLASPGIEPPTDRVEFGAPWIMLPVLYCLTTGSRGDGDLAMPSVADPLVITLPVLYCLWTCPARCCCCCCCGF